MGLAPGTFVKMEIFLFLCTSLLPFLLVSANVNIFKMEQQQFIGRDASGSVFNNDMNEIFPIAYYDINADKLTDLIAVSRNRRSINIFLAYTEPPYLRRAYDSHKIDGGDPDNKIISVVPGDFTGDGMADLMITFAKDTHEHESEVEVVFCLIGFSKSGEEVTLDCQKPGAGGMKKLAQEPTVLDLNGDMVLDLVGEIWTEQVLKNRSKEKRIWLSGAKHDRFEWHEQTFNIINPKGPSNLPMTKVSSNAFADIDGDNIPELLILTEDPNTTPDKSIHFLETYNLARTVNSVKFVQRTAPANINPENQTQLMGQPIITDFEHNGILSHLVPFCSNLKCNGNNGIYVIDNGQAHPLPLGPMSYEDASWSFIPPPVPHKHSNKTDNFKMESFYARTISLRLGDYNLDGYPDLLGVLKTVSHPGESYTTRAVMFENVPCIPAPRSPCHYNRTFLPNFDIFKKYTNVISATFYDIADNGVLDVILVTQHQDGQTPTQNQTFVIKAFENEMNFDSSFLKVMVLIGQRCTSPNCTSDIPYGNVLPGATIKYASLNSQGRQEEGVVAQTYRTSHMPLDLPCEIFGISHSPNFIETLTVAIAPSAGEVYVNDWPQIIPNSQIVIFPYVVDKPSKWTMKLFLTPSDVVLKTFGVLVAICGILGTLVGALEFKERREDRIARQSEAHRLVMY